jgi:phytol kinase
MIPLALTALGSLLLGLTLATVAGGLTRAGEEPRRLARKVFHLGVFTGAVPAHLLQGFWGVVVYGSVMAGLVLVALLHGPGLAFYEALARPEKGTVPRDTVLRPLLATAFGGLLAALLVGELAVVGYLVCGWGDAAGEIVGARWGRRRYRRPFAGAGEGSRSLEGSTAVLAVGALGAAVAVLLLGRPLQEAAVTGALCGAMGALAEGISGPGTDNLWAQLVPSLGAWWILG